MKTLCEFWAWAWKLIIDGITQINLARFSKKYAGVVNSTDVRVFQAIEEFRKFHGLNIHEMRIIFNKIGFSRLIDVRYMGYGCIAIDDQNKIYFHERFMTKELWVDNNGKIAKYRLNSSGEPVEYQRCYEPLGEINYKLTTFLEDKLIELKTPKGLIISIKLVMDVNEFRQISPRLEEIILEERNSDPMTLHDAIKRCCPGAPSILVKHEIYKKGKRVELSNVSSEGKCFLQVGELFRGSYLSVSGCGWTYISKDASMKLSYDDIDSHISFTGEGENGAVSGFLFNVNAVKAEVIRLVETYQL